MNRKRNVKLHLDSSRVRQKDSQRCVYFYTDIPKRWLFVLIRDLNSHNSKV